MSRWKGPNWKEEMMKKTRDKHTVKQGIKLLCDVKGVPYQLWKDIIEESLPLTKCLNVIPTLPPPGLRGVTRKNFLMYVTDRLPNQSQSDWESSLKILGPPFNRKSVSNHNDWKKPAKNEMHFQWSQPTKKMIKECHNIIDLFVLCHLGTFPGLVPFWNRKIKEVYTKEQVIDFHEDYYEWYGAQHWIQREGQKHPFFNFKYYQGLVYYIGTGSSSKTTSKMWARICPLGQVLRKPRPERNYWGN